MVASGRHSRQRRCGVGDDDTESEYRGRLFSDSARCIVRRQQCVCLWGVVIPSGIVDTAGGVSCASFPWARACRVRLAVTDERSDGPHPAHVARSDAVLVLLRIFNHQCVKDLSDERPDFDLELAAGCAQRFDEYCRDQGSYRGDVRRPRHSGSESRRYKVLNIRWGRWGSGSGGRP